MLLRSKRLFNTFVLILTDMSALTLAVLVSHGIRLWLDRFEAFADYDGNWHRFTFSGLLYLFLFLLFYFFGLYTRRYDFWEETRRIFQAVFFLFIMVAAYVFVTKTSLEYSRAMVVLIFLNMAWLLPLLRIVSKKVLNLFGTWQIPALVIGKSEQVERLRKDLEANWYLGYRPVDELGWGGVVFIMTKGMSTERIEKLIADYKNRLYGVVVIPYLGNLSFANADIVDLRIGQISMINIQNQLSRPRNILLKRTAEFLAVLAVLPLGIVIYAVVSIWIKLDSRGPVLFRQKRLGRHGEPFECYKFRTMYLESESLLENYLETYPEEREHYTLFHKYRHDPRITRAGRWLRKTSLDELPQLINILKGEMSLIGPRPYMLEEEEKLGNDAKTILYVRPGITGFWQIKGRNDLTFRERKDLDVWYIQNWSLWLDFVIFMKTFEVLLTRKGAR